MNLLFYDTQGAAGLIDHAHAWAQPVFGVVANGVIKPTLKFHNNKENLLQMAQGRWSRSAVSRHNFLAAEKAGTVYGMLVSDYAKTWSEPHLDPFHINLYKRTGRFMRRFRDQRALQLSLPTIRQKLNLFECQQRDDNIK
jgi:hypothetical protein